MVAGVTSAERGRTGGGTKGALGSGEADTRACLKIAFCQLCVPLCGRFGPNERGVAGYVK